MPRRALPLIGLVIAGLQAASVEAGSIDTAFLEAPWPKQRVHDYEVGTDTIRWRQKAGAGEGIFAGASFTAPADLQRTWGLSTSYADLGPMTPGVRSVQVIEESENRRVIAIEIKVLWKELRLVFEVEQEPPEAVRFRLVHEVIGDYRGVCLLRAAEPDQTRVEMATWLKPAVRVPSGLVLWVERGVMLKGIRNFLETCREGGGVDNPNHPIILPGDMTTR
ncbi:MAG: hypothetical protein A3I71_07200 [Omnitrophica WOR_2 bacterium RIFCSPLOWO2_02_FULL_63_16]|nr:MAG: hypothetical protein A3I71_07200 [Omnitrophica WOR_2 bacterium RIFCSPLOWO2_02_FULL_63_16]